MARWSAAGSNWPRPATSASPRPSTFYGLPEGQRGIFVGGGGSARIPRLIGVARMTDLMMTGRVYDADEGQRRRPVAIHACADGQALAKALALAERIAGNAPMSNFAVMHALPRIADQSQSEGLFTESLMAAVAESTPEAQYAAARLPRRARRQGGKVIMSVVGRQAGTRRRLHRSARRNPRRRRGAAELRPRRCGAYPQRLTDCLEHWARETPDAHAGRAPRRRRWRWRHISYAQMLDARPGRRAGAGRRSICRPSGRSLILSGNDLEHLTLALGAMWAGVPFVPVSPAYSLVSQDYGKLRHILAHRHARAGLRQQCRLRAGDRRPSCRRTRRWC